MKNLKPASTGTKVGFTVTTLPRCCGQTEARSGSGTGYATEMSDPHAAGPTRPGCGSLRASCIARAAQHWCGPTACAGSGWWTGSGIAWTAQRWNASRKGGNGSSTTSPYPVTFTPRWPADLKGSLPAKGWPAARSCSPGIAQNGAQRWTPSVRARPCHG